MARNWGTTSQGSALKSLKTIRGISQPLHEHTFIHIREKEEAESGSEPMAGDTFPVGIVRNYCESNLARFFLPARERRQDTRCLQIL